MAKKYFLGSVGNVEALRYNTELNRWEVAFRSKTLTDSGINISTTKDDIRAGTGAPIQFSFYHDPSVEINLTDVVFDQAYIEAQLGAEFETGGDIYKDETLEFTSDALTVELSEMPMPMAGSCNDAVVIRYTKQGENDWKTLEEGGLFTQAGQALTLNDALKAGKYCFRYLYRDPAAQVAKITSEIIPQELFLIITAPVYAGDACSASNGKRAGTITYEIPRFRLNGSQDFAMNMSSNQTMSLAGVAMASEDGCNDEGSDLLKIAIKYDGMNWYDDVKELIADEDYLKVGDVPHIYALRDNGKVSLIDNDLLVFVPVLSAGKFAEAGAQKVQIKQADEVILEENLTIVAA